MSSPYDKYEIANWQQHIPSPAFPLGKVTIFETAVRMLVKHSEHPLALLARHARGDHGSMDDEDVMKNEAQIEALQGNPDVATLIMSSYPLGSSSGRSWGDRVWIITRTGAILSDGPFTEILLPSDY